MSALPKIADPVVDLTALKQLYYEAGQDFNYKRCNAPLEAFWQACSVYPGLMQELSDEDEYTCFRLFKLGFLNRPMDWQ